MQSNHKELTPLIKIVEEIKNPISLLHQDVMNIVALYLSFHDLLNYRQTSQQINQLTKNNPLVEKILGNMEQAPSSTSKLLAKMAVNYDDTTLGSFALATTGGAVSGCFYPGLLFLGLNCCHINIPCVVLGYTTAAGTGLGIIQQAGNAACVSNRNSVSKFEAELKVTHQKIDLHNNYVANIEEMRSTVTTRKY